MNAVVGAFDLIVAAAYLGLGVQAVRDVARYRRTDRGVMLFGTAYALIAISCGPEHLVHAIQAFDGDRFGWLLTVADGFAAVPVLVFVALRVERALGGRGDRFIAGTPMSILLTVSLFWAAVGGLVVPAVIRIADGAHRISLLAIGPSAVIALTFTVVATMLMHTQTIRSVDHGGWSLSGLALAGFFQTSALSHLVYGLAASRALAICPPDWFGVLASLYFLWVVRHLYTLAIVGWNRRPLIGASRRAERAGPWGERRDWESGARQAAGELQA